MPRLLYGQTGRHGIERFYWKRIPWGLADTERGLYPERHDLAKIMTLFQHNGVWEGEQVVSAERVRDSLAPTAAPYPQHDVRFGYSWWLYPCGKDDARLAFAGSGFGGQLPIAIPAYDIVMVFTAWNVQTGPGPRRTENPKIDLQHFVQTPLQFRDLAL